MSKLPLVLAAALASAALAGCIGTDPDGPRALDAGPDPPRATFVARDYALSGPAKVPAGWVEVRVRNEGQDLHHAYVLRLPEGRTPGDFRAALAEGKGPPAWARAAGGPNAVMPGGEAGAISHLEPGAYVVLCVIPDLEHVPHHVHGMVASFVVEGPPRAAAPPRPDQAVALVDFAFAPDKPLAAGTRTIAYRNVGQEIHEAVLVRLDPGATLDDLLATVAGERPGPLPGAFVGGVVGMEPGEWAYITQAFEPGRYGYLCFFGEEKGEPPHFTKGMRLEFDVA